MIVHKSDIQGVYDVERRLDSEHITYPSPLATDHYEGYYLSAIQDNFKEFQSFINSDKIYLDHYTLYYEFDEENRPVFSKNSLRDEIIDYVHQDIPILGSEYQYIETFFNTPLQPIFAQTWEDIPFFDETSQLKLELSELPKENNQLYLKSYTQTHLIHIEPLREKQSLISEKDAIFSLYLNNKLPSDSIIQGTLLAYSSIFTVQEKIVYIPVWFVAVETHKDMIQIERVNAFNSMVLSQGVSEVQ